MTTTTLNRDASLSTLADVAYLPNPPEKIGNWTRIGDPQSNPSSGFFGVAYVNNVTKEVVVSFRGTDNVLAGDLKASIAILNGNWHPQFQDAAAFTASVKGDERVAKMLSDQGYTLLTTGHSLGGGIGQFIAKMFDLNGASFDAPGANAVTNSQGFLRAKAQFAPDSTGEIGAQYFNYIVQGSGISMVGTHLGQNKTIVNLTDPSSTPLLIGLLGAMTGGTALGLLGLLGSANVSTNHPMEGIGRAIHMAAGLEQALGDGSLKMATIPLSQATGQPWTDETSEPRVTVFQDANNQTKAIVQRTGSAWVVSTLDQSTVITLTPPATEGGLPTCIVQQPNKPTLSCTMDQNGNQVTFRQDTNADGRIDSITTTKSSIHVVETTVDSNADGQWDQTSVATDTNNDGTLDHTTQSTPISDTLINTKTDDNGDGNWDSDIANNTQSGNSYDLNTFAGLTDYEYQLSQNHDIGLVNDSYYEQFTTDFSHSLIADGSSFVGPPAPTDFPSYDPIGAFYESNSAAYDTAASIASKTGVLLGADGRGLSAAALAARDTNGDARLSGTELSGLQIWNDLNEDGIQSLRLAA